MIVPDIQARFERHFCYIGPVNHLYDSMIDRYTEIHHITDKTVQIGLFIHTEFVLIIINFISKTTYSCANSTYLGTMMIIS